MRRSEISKSKGGYEELEYDLMVTPSHYAIIEAKLAEESRREIDERYRFIFDQAPVGIVCTAPNGQFLDVNDKICKLVKYEKSELLKLKYQDITHEDDQFIDIYYANRMLRNDSTSCVFEKRYIRRDGKILHIKISVSIMRTSTGRPRYFLAFIEELKKMNGSSSL